MAIRVRAVRDEALRARIVSRTALRYESGPDPEDDRPAHVRAGSGLVRFGKGLAVVQDDADFVALVDATTGAVRAVPLPRRGRGARQFDDERGNKAEKLDFEACVAARIDGVDTLVAFGSGSTPARESILVMAAEGVPRVLQAPDLYRSLRAEREFSGSELNLEGAVLVGSSVRLFQRGNGAVQDGRSPVNATCDVPWSYVIDVITGGAVTPPTIHSVVEFDLGEVSGIPYTFTDATGAASGSILYLAAAEASPDAVKDGAVVGAAIGAIRPAGPDLYQARYASLLDERGVPACEKAEGIALSGGTTRAHVVLDVDDPRRPSELCLVELTGPW